MARQHFDDEAPSAATTCGCFRHLCGDDEPRGYTNVREVMEGVAGTKWNKLVTKLARICNPGKFGRPTSQFRYSPESYALNFSGDGAEEDDCLLHSFSTRFAPGLVVVDHQRKGAAMGL